jgi:DHA1 family bicyclomycin/chloramphenicol resistance-like MFS transporter
MLPNAIAGAVSIRPQAAGTASGLLGFTQMLFGAFTAQLAGHLIASATTPWPMLAHMMTIAIAAVVVFLVLIRPHPMPAHK